MKKLLLFLFISYQSFGQMHALYEPTYPTNQSMLITPHGISKGRVNNPGSNISFGASSLSVNMTGNYNTAIGISTLSNLVDGSGNTAIGHSSMFNKTYGSDNTAVGFQSNYYGWNNHSNTAIGRNALFYNNGHMNVAVGKNALYNNSVADENVAVGNESLYNNWYGYYNTGIGSSTLFRTAKGYNTALGYRAGYANVGSHNTYLGHNADSNSEVYNSTAIGYGAIVDASNKVRIGNSAVNVIEGQVPWSNPSDRRLKENITYTNRLGLDFITRLQTVSYNYIADTNKTRYDGFIAQDVEKVMKDLGVSFSGLKKSADGTYSLAYSDFVMPLVNAVKEQQAKIERLEKQNQILSASLAEIQEIRAELNRLRESKDIGK